jgi:hypothetical protein
MPRNDETLTGKGFRGMFPLFLDKRTNSRRYYWGRYSGYWRQRLLDGISICSYILFYTNIKKYIGTVGTNPETVGAYGFGRS